MTIEWPNDDGFDCHVRMVHKHFVGPKAQPMMRERFVEPEARRVWSTKPRA